MKRSAIPMLALLSIALFLHSPFALGQEAPYFASGIKVGEATQDSVIVWVRLTKEPQARFHLNKMFTEGVDPEVKDNQGEPMPTNVAPGMEGQARVRYWSNTKPDQVIETAWSNTNSDSDYTIQFTLSDLKPGATYRFQVEAKTASDATDSSQPQLRKSEVGSFHTAPTRDSIKPIQFIVTTCQAIRSIDSGTDGHKAYIQMLALDPNFFVHTGDIVYYDKVPLCKNVAQARAKWNLMFAYGYKRQFHRNVSSYFMKDDHDTLKNDCWRGQKYGDLTFEQGLDIFREQVCMGEKTYRTVRWGKHVQIWMTENRDFRSPNRMTDGPEKTILGSEQKEWLKQTLTESDATFKFVISPGPLVGPDKKGKSDNHANEAFFHEGNELRQFLSKLPNAYVICGDRHWQYCSQDPETRLIELGCGPVNDEHDFGGDPGYDPKYHRYFGSRGGFLGVKVEGDTATAQWFSANEPLDSNGMPKVLHTETFHAANQR